MSETMRLATPKMMAVRAGWMVVSAPGSRIMIGGKPAETKDDAMRHFDESLKAWEELDERARSMK